MPAWAPTSRRPAAGSAASSTSAPTRATSWRSMRAESSSSPSRTSRPPRWRRSRRRARLSGSSGSGSTTFPSPADGTRRRSMNRRSLFGGLAAVGMVYDGVSASGDATNRLIANGDVAEINPALIPDWNNIAPFLQSPPHNTVNGKHYGVSHGWGGNSLMYRTDLVTPAPMSWDVVFDPAKANAYKGKVTDYDSPIYIADAALYLKAHNSALGITDPYELTQPQFDAAVQLLKDQRPLVGKFWAAYTDEIDNFTNGSTIIGTTWPYQVNTLKGAGVKVEAVVPTEGMTGWADTWMMSAHAQHPNCMYLWMGWMVTKEVQAQVAESFGESPANPQACELLDKGDLGPYALKDFCTAYRVNDKSFYDAISFWKTPLADCGDSRGQTCVDYSVWSQKWTEIKG